MDESLLVPEVLPDFGQAEFTTGARGGALLTYHSKKYPGKVFHFKIYGQSSSQRRYFACKGCMDMKRLYGNIILGKEGGYCTSPLVRRIGRKINGPIRILTANTSKTYIRIRIPTFSPVDVFLVDNNLWDQFVFWGPVLPCLPMYGFFAYENSHKVILEEILNNNFSRKFLLGKSQKYPFWATLYFHININKK